MSVWNCGGGVDSTAIACLIVAGRLPKPDYAVMVDAGYERQSTWHYVWEVISPRLAAIGVRLQVIRTSDWRSNALVDGHGRLLLPAFTRRGGKTAKLPTYCSGAWKGSVTRRWLRAQGVARCSHWLGIAANEAHRARPSNVLWCENRYPLVEMEITRAEAVRLTSAAGWPPAPRTSCVVCPNQNAAEWQAMANEEPEEFRRACQLEAQIHVTHPDAWLSRACVALSATLVGVAPTGCLPDRVPPRSWVLPEPRGR